MTRSLFSTLVLVNVNVDHCLAIASRDSVAACLANVDDLILGLLRLLLCLLHLLLNLLLGRKHLLQDLLLGLLGLLLQLLLGLLGLLLGLLGLLLQLLECLLPCTTGHHLAKDLLLLGLGLASDLHFLPSQLCKGTQSLHPGLARFAAATLARALPRPTSLFDCPGSLADGPRCCTLRSLHCTLSPPLNDSSTTLRSTDFLGLALFDAASILLGHLRGLLCQLTSSSLRLLGLARALLGKLGSSLRSTLHDLRSPLGCLNRFLDRLVGDLVCQLDLGFRLGHLLGLPDLLPLLLPHEDRLLHAELSSPKVTTTAPRPPVLLAPGTDSLHDLLPLGPVRCPLLHPAKASLLGCLDDLLDGRVLPVRAPDGALHLSAGLALDCI